MPTLNSNGLTAGGLAGYNWGFNGFVLGGEMEAGYDRRAANSNFNNNLRNVAELGNAEGRLRARLGYAWGNILFFGAAGGTVADLKLTNTTLVAINNFLPLGASQEVSHWRGGFNVGGGVEWAFADHWTIRGEYIYDGFGSRLYDFRAQNPNGFDSRTAKLQESTARAVLAYKF
jgi:opacity protein-like surface antigen